MLPDSPYIDQSEGVRIAGTRVGLDTIIVNFKEDQTPEQIVESFPTVTLAQIYGAIAYYLDNKQLVDDYFAEVERKFHRLVPPLNEANPELYARLMAAREE